MENQEDYLLRPVLAHLCMYTDLKNGALSLADIAIMHEALDAQDENQARIRAAAPRER